MTVMSSKIGVASRRPRTHRNTWWGWKNHYAIRGKEMGANKVIIWLNIRNNKQLVSRMLMSVTPVENHNPVSWLAIYLPRANRYTRNLSNTEEHKTPLWPSIRGRDTQVRWWMHSCPKFASPRIQRVWEPTTGHFFSHGFVIKINTLSSWQDSHTGELWSKSQDFTVRKAIHTSLTHIENQQQWVSQVEWPRWVLFLKMGVVVLSYHCLFHQKFLRWANSRILY